MATKTPTTKPLKSTAAKSVAAVSDESGVKAEKSGHQFVRRKEFVARVVASSGLKPNAVKSALDAVLQEIGDALSNDEALNLPPLGKLSVKRKRELANGEMLVCKLRRSSPPPKVDTPLADTAEDS